MCYVTVWTPVLSMPRLSDRGRHYVLAWSLSPSPVLIDVSAVPCPSKPLYFASLGVLSLHPGSQDGKEITTGNQTQWVRLKLKLSHRFCLPWDVVGYEREVLVSSAQLQGPVRGNTTGSGAGSMMATGR